jgi:hypothetical protein
MPQRQGAYRLGKALIEVMEGLQGKLDIRGEGDNIVLAQTDANTHRIKVALAEAGRESGFIGLALLAEAAMKTYPFIEGVEEVSRFSVRCAAPSVECPECEQVLDTDALKCPTCTAADHYDGPVQTDDYGHSRR